RRGHCSSHSDKASGNQLGAFAVFDGAILGSLVDSSAELPFHLSLRARKNSKLAAPRVVVSVATPVRIAHTEIESVPRQNIFRRGLCCGRHRTWIRRCRGRGE